MVTVSAASYSKTQGPRVSRCEAASWPITAILDAPITATSGSKAPSFLSSTAVRSAATRAASRCSGASSTDATALTSSAYGFSNRPRANFAVSTRRTDSSMVLLADQARCATASGKRGNRLDRR